MSNNLSSPEPGAFTSRQLLIWSFALLLLVSVLWILNLLFVSGRAKPGEFGDMFGAVNAFFSGLAFAGVVLAIILQGKEMTASRHQFSEAAKVQQEFFKQERSANRREATQRIFDDWWSEELSDWRHHFNVDFLPVAVEAYSRYSLKDVHIYLNDPDRRLAKLTGFFDYVGWLGAAGLIDVDYVLGPIQHQARRIWIATEPLILRARYPEQGVSDPIFRMGFEWIILRSEVQANDHANILREAFSNPSIISTEQAQHLREVFLAEEARLRNDLRIATSTVDS